MKISREDFKFASIGLIIVCLLVINGTVYAYTGRAKKQYDVALGALKNQQRAELLTIVQKQNQLTREHQIIQAVTHEQQTKIDALNNGQSVTVVSQSNKSDCSSYEKPWRRLTDSSTCGFLLTKAVGDLKLLVVEFVAPDVDMNSEETKSFLAAMNNDSPKVMYYQWNQPTINYLKTYFESEAKKFDAHFTLKIDKQPPIVLHTFPPYHGKSREEQLKEISKSSDFFLDELIKAKVDVRDYDAVALMVFTKSYSPFISFALPNIRANVTQTTINPYSLADTAVLAHETAHLFGAEDQYIEGQFGCPPDTKDEYTTGGKDSLMCIAGTIDLDSQYTNVINKRAAREMEWIQ